MTSSQIQISGFSAEQVNSIKSILLPALKSALNQIFELYFDPLSMISKPAQASKQKQKQQIITKDSTESTTKSTAEKSTQQ